MTLRRRQALRIGAAGAILSAVDCTPSWAQSPAGLGNGNVRITSTLPTGSGPDTIARMLAEKLQVRWRRIVVVDPKPGGAGVVAINAVKGQPPTGNDLVVADVGNLAINPLIFRKLAYDPEKDLVPVAVLYKKTFFVAVNANGPYRTFQDLLAASRVPGKHITYGSNAVGSPIHLWSARLENAMGVEMTHLPYKETSQLYVAVASGEIDWAFRTIASASPLVKAGKLRFLAVDDSKRSLAMPDVPTLAEAGGPKGTESRSWVALMAPRGTPAALVALINQAVNDAMAEADVREKLDVFGFIPSPGPASQVSDLMRSDRARYAEVLKRVKVNVD